MLHGPFFERTHEICVLLAVGWNARANHEDDSLRIRAAWDFSAVLLA